MRRMVLLAGLLLAAPAARAQELPTRLTLEDALRIAKANNPTYLQAVNGLEGAAAQERQAWGQLLPSLSTGLDFSGSRSRRISGESDLGEVVVDSAFRESTGSRASQRVSLSVTLFDGFGNLNRLRAERAGMQAAEAAVAAAELQLRQEVMAAYYEAVQAERRLEVEEALLASAREQLGMTEQRFQIGSANREDVLGAQVTVSNRERAVLQARGEVEKSQLGLLRVLGVEGEPGFALEDDFPEVFDPARLDVDALVGAAVASSPRVLQQVAEARRAELSAAAARGQRWPTISGSVSYGRGIDRRGYGAFFELDPPNRSWSFNIGVELPLFDGFRTSSQIAQAEVAAANARQRARAERLAVETEVEQALVDLVNAYRAVELADRALALSQERLELTQERYRTGTSVSFLQLQSAIDQAASAEQGAIVARFNFVTALVNLETKVGREVRP
ncbi:MAG TPA: TolC family protein [Longimicrobiales bacterium]